ncbi:hypothetical protein [Nocardioides sp. CER19]|uniref:hypothetical protein n=1 Tax=Nocardioides sp. CER19 TaxID=3038538 RepID=UPI002449EB5B|nr:hypothetical protein [Nocardioides sp. CER19]MDH2415933.1 hypothetical protein [Nocardioides sp. CER19]
MRHQTSRVLADLALAGVVSAALAACGSGNSRSTSSPMTPPTSTDGMSSSATTATAAPPTTQSTAPATHPTEFNPPGDIPDNAVFVDHVAPGSHVHFTVPEGWAQSAQHGTASFTDHYNSIAIQVVAAPQAPTAASARQVDVPQLKASESHFQLIGIDTVSRKGAGTAVRIRYLIDSKPDPVTGKVVRDAVERYEFWHHDQDAILALTGPRNADNVDPWQTVSDSVTWK